LGGGGGVKKTKKKFWGNPGYFKIKWLNKIGKKKKKILLQYK
jgi:hypothetical protein